MLARNEVIFKWALYGAVTALCFFLQGAFFQRFTLWGVLPFVYPLLAAIPATYEAPVPATIFALCVGVVCDALLLWISGRNVWRAGLFLLLRELCVTLPFSLPVILLYRMAARKVHLYD